MVTSHRDVAILTTMGELERWRKRRASLADELTKASRQVAYYEALVKDMKREVQPSRLADFLRKLRP
ncbi:MAG TPA: hypothetical protein VM889_00705 [Candidatus Thermoplasmatota archaeon]|nr:hypothetical protein [Candidatus Thermoplasmatota archaeon]